MIIFINGSFGIGKTVVGERLARTIPNSLLYDPEEVGLMLRNILKPVDWSGDFQDYPMWRRLVIDVAGMIQQQYRHTLVMPMTIWRVEYFQEVMSSLKKIDPDIHHFCLTAPYEVIHDRLVNRGEQVQGDWVFDQIEKCTAAFELPLFEERIDTAHRTPEQITDYILAKVASASVPS
jgi:deoxyadenosine/deoxycytidine kinase